MLLSILLRAARVAVNYVVFDEPIVFDTGDDAEDLVYLAVLFRAAAQALSMWLNSVPGHADVKVDELFNATRLMGSIRETTGAYPRRVQAAFFFDDFTHASTKATPSTPSSTVG